jgi:hypothetical protein
LRISGDAERTRYLNEANGKDLENDSAPVHEWKAAIPSSYGTATEEDGMFPFQSGQQQNSVECHIENPAVSGSQRMRKQTENQLFG